MLGALDAAEQRAQQVYRRVMDRYKENAKLYKAYGRILEDVRHDPWRAASYYRSAPAAGLPHVHNHPVACLLATCWVGRLAGGLHACASRACSGCSGAGVAGQGS